MRDNLYFDNAATTALCPAALEAMMPYLTDTYANPNSVYSAGQRVRAAIDTSRAEIAAAIGAAPAEIFFTSSGTEADNWAIKGSLTAAGGKKHVITSGTEHHGILFTCKALEKQGIEVTYLPVDADGFVSPADLEAAIRPETAVISIMLANNETGTIQPMGELSGIASARGVPFHTDAIAAAGHIPVDVNELGVSMLSLSAHKFHGPKGIGALYIKKGTPISAMFHGGFQEKNLRAGTENVPGIIGMAAALTHSIAEMPHTTVLRDKLIREILAIPHTRINGPVDTAGEGLRLPGNVNACFEFIEGESLLLLLDMQGVAASTGSACSSGSLDPSHVLLAMGVPHELANGAIRFSLSRGHTARDVDELLYILRGSVEKLRALSPLYDDYLKRSE